MTKTFLYLTAFLVSLAGTSQAQIDFGDSGEPISVAAEKATYKGNLTVLHKNVDVKQGDARIQSDEMEIFRQKRGTKDGAADGTLSLGAVTKIIAKGNFRYVTPENTVTGDQGTYFRDRGVIVVTGNVKVRQPNGTTLSGEKMVYDLKNKRVKFGEECAGDECGGRVNVRLNQ